MGSCAHPSSPGNGPSQRSIGRRCRHSAVQSYAALAPLAELPQLLLSSSQFEEGLRGVRLSVMASTLLANHPRTVVVQKPRKTFGSFLVAKNSNTPYSDATKVSRLSLSSLESSNCLHFHSALKTHDAHTVWASQLFSAMHIAIKCFFLILACSFQIPKLFLS